jgi:putative ABC transport system permease protein
LETLPETAMELTVCGVVRPLPDAANATISTAIGYTSALTDRIIAHTDASAVITAQEQTPQWNVLTGVNFDAADDAQKIADITCYIQAMDASEKVSLYSRLQRYGATGETVPGTVPLDDAAKADFVDQWLENAPDPHVLVSLYGDYLGSTSYGDNLDTFGKVSYDAPSSISIYTDSFEAKDAIAECIHHYNEGVEEDSRITYTDYVKMMTASLTSIIDAISYVLIAFVAVSLVVSSIMIGIITHISVLERTREIGILRAMGASRQNISQVFNAETVIIGLCAGLLGVGITIALTVPINALLSQILGPGSMAAQLPVDSAVVLVGISVIVTVIGGLMPAKKAAKMDPVTALRTE